VSPHPDPLTQPDLSDADYAQQYVGCVYPVGCHSRFHIVMMTRLFSLWSTCSERNCDMIMTVRHMMPDWSHYRIRTGCVGWKTIVVLGWKWIVVHDDLHVSQTLGRFVYYESINREVKRRLVYEYRCDERLKTKTEESTRLSYTGVVCLLWIDKARGKDKTYTWVSVWWKTTGTPKTWLEHLKIETRWLEHLKIETRLINEKIANTLVGERGWSTGCFIMNQ